jgi:predicted nucleotidyltransferase component of viral defense system
MSIAPERRQPMNDVITRMLQRYKAKNHSEMDRALREILQEITLVGLWRGKFFEHAAFYGGTALRILYGLDRFSEDLDFTLLDGKRPFSWSLFENQVIEELSAYGFKVSFLEKKKKIQTPIQSAFLKTNTHHALLQIGREDLSTHHGAVIRIKVEIDSSPIRGFDTESVYLREPLPVSIRALKESSLFAGKVNAALYRAWKERVKGRDWYDLVWFLRRGIPLNPHYLAACMLIQGELEKQENLTEEKVKNRLKTRLKNFNLDAAKEDVRPFLRDPTQLELWSIDFFHHWIDQLKFAPYN